MTSHATTESRNPIILHLLRLLSRVQILLSTLSLTMLSSVGLDFIIHKAVFMTPPVNVIRQNCLVVIQVSIDVKCNRLAFAQRGNTGKVLHPCHQSNAMMGAMICTVEETNFM